MIEHSPAALPSSGVCSIQSLVTALQASPVAFGTHTVGALRSVRMLSDGLWRNLGTILHAIAGAETEPARDIQMGPVRLLSRPINLDEIGDPEALASVLNVWPGVDIHEPGKLQQNVSPYRESSRAKVASYPRWRVNVNVLSDVLLLQHTSGMDSPLFDPASGFFAPSVREGVDKWLGHQGIQGQNQVVIDDRRAVIRSIQREEKNLIIQVDLLYETDVYACVRLTDFRGRTEDHVQRVTDGAAQLSSDEAIQEYSAFLLDGTSTWLDQRDSRLGWGALGTNQDNGDEESERTTLDELHADRDAGEGEEIEFKKWIPPRGEQGKYREMLDTLSAFANGGGGRMYIGVDDRGAIQGLEAALRKEYVKTEGSGVEHWRDIYARRLKQNIAEGIAPEIRPTFQWIDAAGHSVLRITVPRGDRAPYEVSETREIYVRRGATTRRPTPVELRHFFFAQPGSTHPLAVLNGLVSRNRVGGR